MDIFFYYSSLIIITYLQHELPIPEDARSVSWVGDGLIVCIKKDLYHLTVS